MKPRWTISRSERYGLCPPCGAEWVWLRRDRNGTHSVVGCVCHHSWTKRVSAGQVITNAAP